MPVPDLLSPVSDTCPIRSLLTHQPHIVALASQPSGQTRVPTPQPLLIWILDPRSTSEPCTQSLNSSSVRFQPALGHLFDSPTEQSHHLLCQRIVRLDSRFSRATANLRAARTCIHRPVPGRGVRLDGIRTPISASWTLDSIIQLLRQQRAPNMPHLARQTNRQEEEEDSGLDRNVTVAVRWRKDHQTLPALRLSAIAFIAEH